MSPVLHIIIGLGWLLIALSALLVDQSRTTLEPRSLRSANIPLWAALICSSVWMATA